MRAGLAAWVALCVAAALGVAWVFWPGASPGAPEDAGAGDESRTGQTNGVTVTVTWLRSASPDALRLRIVLETHTVDLASFNFTRDVEVVAGDAHWNPVEESPTAAGSSHHRGAELDFEASPAAFTVLVRDLADVPERRFEFG